MTEKYQCTKCKFNTIGKPVFKRHINKDVHIGNVCKFCKKEYESYEILYIHLHSDCIKRYKVLIKKYKDKIMDLEKQLSIRTSEYQDAMIALNREQMESIKHNIDITNDLLIYFSKKNSSL